MRVTLPVLAALMVVALLPSVAPAAKAHATPCVKHACVYKIKVGPAARDWDMPWNADGVVRSTTMTADGKGLAAVQPGTSVAYWVGHGIMARLTAPNVRPVHLHIVNVGRHAVVVKFTIRMQA